MDVVPVVTRGQRPNVCGTLTSQYGLEFVHCSFPSFQNVKEILGRIQDTEIGIRFAQTWSATFSPSCLAHLNMIFRPSGDGCESRLPLA